MSPAEQTPRAALASGRVGPVACLSRVPRPSFAVAGAVFVVEVTVHLVNFGAYDLRIRFLDSSSEWSYSHVLATLAYGAGAIIGGLAATSTPRRRAWCVICGTFWFLVLDNLTRLHQQLDFWPLVSVPLLVVLSVSMVAVGSGTELALAVRTGLGLLFASLAIHVLGPGFTKMLGWESTSWAYQVKVALKEGLELAGWALLVPALAWLGRPHVSRARNLRWRMAES